MNDMIGSAGTLRGWAMLWHMELMWLLPLLLVSVSVLALVEILISKWKSRPSLVELQSIAISAVPGSAALPAPAFTRDRLYDGTPRIALATIPRVHTP